MSSSENTRNTFGLVDSAPGDRLILTERGIQQTRLQTGSAARFLGRLEGLEEYEARASLSQFPHTPVAPGGTEYADEPSDTNTNTSERGGTESNPVSPGISEAMGSFELSNISHSNTPIATPNASRDPEWNEDEQGDESSSSSGTARSGQSERQRPSCRPATIIYETPRRHEGEARGPEASEVRCDSQLPEGDFETQSLMSLNHDGEAQTHVSSESDLIGHHPASIVVTEDSREGERVMVEIDSASQEVIGILQDLKWGREDLAPLTQEELFLIFFDRLEERLESHVALATMRSVTMAIFRDAPQRSPASPRPSIYVHATDEAMATGSKANNLNEDPSLLSPNMPNPEFCSTLFSLEESFPPGEPKKRPFMSRLYNKLKNLNTSSRSPSPSPSPAPSPLSKSPVLGPSNSATVSTRGIGTRSEPERDTVEFIGRSETGFFHSRVPVRRPELLSDALRHHRLGVSSRGRGNGRNRGPSTRRRGTGSPPAVPGFRYYADNIEGLEPIFNSDGMEEDDDADGPHDGLGPCMFGFVRESPDLSVPRPDGRPHDAQVTELAPDINGSTGILVNSRLRCSAPLHLEVPPIEGDDEDDEDEDDDNVNLRGPAYLPCTDGVSVPLHTNLNQLLASAARSRLVRRRRLERVELLAERKAKKSMGTQGVERF